MRRPLGELLVLNLETMQWSRPETQGEGARRQRPCALPSLLL